MLDSSAFGIARLFLAPQAPRQQPNGRADDRGNAHNERYRCEVSPENEGGHAPDQHQHAQCDHRLPGVHADHSTRRVKHARRLWGSGDMCRYGIVKSGDVDGTVYVSCYPRESMPDDKRGRDKQAHDQDRRQRERDLAVELERMDESEPPVQTVDLEDIEADLSSLAFPATAADVVATAGERRIDADVEYRVEEVVPDTEELTYEEREDVLVRVKRPTVGAAMKSIVEAAATRQDVSLDGSRRTAYEKTLRALAAIDADDDDEGVAAITDWLLDHLETKARLPDSRAVRREAARFCRERGYEIRNDEWLGV